MTTIKELRKGDKVTIARTVTVSSVDVTEGTFMTADKRTIRVADRTWESTVLPKFEITNHVSAEPDNWPPAAGQVWADSKGKTYHVLGQAAAIYSGDKNVPVSSVILKNTEGIHLVFPVKDVK